MKLRTRVQPALVQACMDDHDMFWFFTCCKRGFEQFLGRKVKVKEEIPANLLLWEDGTPYEDVLARLNEMFGR